MSDFSDLFEEALDLLGDTAGRATYTIDGFAGRVFSGDLDEFGADSLNLSRQGSGFVGVYGGCLLTSAAQFAGIPDPERTLVGHLLTVKDRKVRIASASIDAATITIRLENPDKRS